MRCTRYTAEYVTLIAACEMFFASINLCNITNIARLPSHMKSVLEEITRLTAECHQRLMIMFPDLNATV